MGVLFIDNGQIRTYPVNDVLSIGRDGGNEIVVVHPTVSRKHARIERQAGHYLIIDTNSRNGTRVNGKIVRESEMLVDGARLRIGHVRAWFFREMPPKLPRSASRNNNGIVFNCNCGTRLWAANDAVGITVTCGQCNEQIEVPPLDEDDDEPVSGKTVAGVVFDAGAVQQEKKTVCNICQWAIEKDEHPQICPECKHSFHADCWKENKGCSTYGCVKVNSLVKQERPKTPVPIQHTASSPSSISTPTAAVHVTPIPSHVSIVDTTPIAAVQKKPSFAWAHALLAMAVIGSLLGVLGFGIPAALVAIIALGRLLISRTDSKTVLFLSTVISTLGTAAGVTVSRFWWMGKDMSDWKDVFDWIEHVKHLL